MVTAVDDDERYGSDMHREEADDDQGKPFFEPHHSLLIPVQRLSLP